MKKAAYFVLASAILFGCELEEGALDGGVYAIEENDNQVTDIIKYEKQLLIGISDGMDIIEHKNKFIVGESITVIVGNGNVPYGDKEVVLYYYHIVGDNKESLLLKLILETDPMHSWALQSFFPLEETDVGNFRIRVFIGGELFGETDFEVIDEEQPIEGEAL